MSDSLYLLSEDDIITLREIVRAVKRQGRNPYGRPAIGEDDLPNASDCYLIRTPPGGIEGPTQTGTGTGSVAISNEVTFAYVKVPIYQLVGSFGSTFAAQKISGLDLQAVYAINAVSGDVWCIVQRDKFGNWWVVEDQPPDLAAWAQVTNTTTTSLLVNGGGPLALYPANLTVIPTGAMMSGYLYSVNGNDHGACPVLDNFYECQFLGTASDGKPVYQADIQAELDATTTRWGLVTTTTQEFAGLKEFDDAIEVRTSPSNGFTSLNSTVLAFSTTDGNCFVKLVQGSLGDFQNAADGVGFWTILEGVALGIPQASNPGAIPFNGCSADLALAANINANGVDDGIGNVVGNGFLQYGVVLYAPLNNPAYCIGGATNLAIGGTAEVILNPTDPVANQVRLTFRGGLFLGISGNTSGFGSSTGSGGGSGSGITFGDLCPGKSFKTTYTLTISGTCSAINGTYTITWNGGEWTWTGVISGVTVEFIIADNSGVPAFYMDENGGGALSALNNATSYTCPPTFTANGTATLVGVGHIPLCPAATVNWSVS